MRKIEEEMIRAIRARKDWKKDNTQVICCEDRLWVYLHGKLICQYFYNKAVVISHCGWKTATTKSRLNAILQYFGLSTIQQKKWDWYIDNKFWFSQYLEYATSK